MEAGKIPDIHFKDSCPNSPRNGQVKFKVSRFHRFGAIVIKCSWKWRHGLLATFFVRKCFRTSLEALHPMWSRPVTLAGLQLLHWISVAHTHTHTHRDSCTQHIDTRARFRWKLYLRCSLRSHGGRRQYVIYDCWLVLGVCSPNPCYHGGTCSESDSKYHCKCPSNFYGRQCESEQQDYSTFVLHCLLSLTVIRHIIVVIDWAQWPNHKR